MEALKSQHVVSPPKGVPGRAPVKTRVAGAQYVYGVLRASERDLELGSLGIDGEEVRTVTAGRLAAVVSHLALRGPILALRKNMAPHHQVLLEVMRSRAVLPLRFGHVASSPKAVARFLEQHGERLLESLSLVEGCCEMTLRVSLKAVNPFEWIVARHAELSRLRDELFAPGASPGHQDKLRLGRLFEACLARERESHEQRILVPLERLCRQTLQRPVVKESVLLDVAMLVRHEDRDLLELRLEELASGFGEEILFNLVGPNPPFSFTDVDKEL